MCNYMKGVLGEDQFIQKCIKISKLHDKDDTDVPEYIELSDIESW